MLLILFLVGVIVPLTICDQATDQLINFKRNNIGRNYTWTTSTGCPIDIKQFNGLNTVLLTNKVFMESMPSLVRERITDRVVHAKGAGAFGYFEVTHDVTDICKAKLFSEVGKKTPVFVRFSQTNLDKAEADTKRDSRGFAIKFYTEEGNFDLACFHIPVFGTKDPNLFPPAVHAGKRNPVTNLRDTNMIWDFVSFRPEAIHSFMYLYGPYGIPDGYRHMPGYSVHTYQIVNEYGKLYFVRFHIHPTAGIKSLSFEEAQKIAGEDPDYAVRDLYNAIENGDYPSWTVKVQVLSYDDIKRAEFDPFDLVKILPLKKYPLRSVGKIVLFKNPTNYFAQVEQVAFNPANTVPGILGAPDKTFEARSFAYKDAQIYRLGVNFDKIDINCPFSSVFSYNRDGMPPVRSNGGRSPNYYPNSYNGPVPCADETNLGLIKVKHDDSNALDQAAGLYNEMTQWERSILTKNLASSLRTVTDRKVLQRVIKWFTIVNSELGLNLSKLVL